MRYQNVELHNIAEIHDGVLYRIPASLLPDLNEKAQARASWTAGAEVRFKLVGESATVTLQMVEEPAIAEVYAGPFLMGWHIIQTTPTAITVKRPEHYDVLLKVVAQDGAPFAVDCYRVVLPWQFPVRLLDIAGDVTPPARDQYPRQRWLAYGSSITQGTISIRPTDSYVMRTAHLLGVDLINLGFGGGAHCEQAMARYIADRDDWDFATLEVGINMWWRFESPEFEARVRTFITTIARAHPDKWIFCLDMLPFRGDFGDDRDRLVALRRVVPQVVAELNQPKLVHIETQPLMPTLTGLSADALHPAPGGMWQIASNLAGQIQRHLGQ